MVGLQDGGHEDSKYRMKGWRLRKYLTSLGVVFSLLLIFLLMVQRYALPSTVGSANNNLHTKNIANGVPRLRQTVATAEEEYPIGFARIPQIPAGASHPDDGKLHVIFSSGCNYFQHWQSELLLATAKLVGQRGRITRIVSGCHDRTAEKIRHTHQTFPEGRNDLLVPMAKLNRSINENFGLYITPSFDGARDFPWINKPSSIEYFMQHARPELDRMGETVIAILDPDFLFLRPLSQSDTDPANIITSRGQEKDPEANKPLDWVKLGRPVAQRYGLEGGWVHMFGDKLVDIVGDSSSPALTWTSREAAQHTSVGPPLMLHVDDLTKLSKLWAKYMRPVLEHEKDILADMWAYSIASAHLGLKHTTLDQYMVSTSGRSGQAYPFIDVKDLSCRNPLSTPANRLPVFIHMASNFKAPDRYKGPWMFHKGHVPADILECDSPLIIQPPDDLWRMTDEPKAKQNAWILCHAIYYLNHVASLYKEKFCKPGYENRQLVKLIQRKSTDLRCSETKDKWCYPIAQIEGLGDEWRSKLRDA